MNSDSSASNPAIGATPLMLSGFLGAFTAAGFLVGILEWGVYASDHGLESWLSLSPFSPMVALAGAIFLTPVFLVAGHYLTNRMSGALRRVRPESFWLTFFVLFFMAFVPYPFFYLVAKASGSITDADLLVRFSSSAGILATGAALMLSACLALVSYALLKPAGLLAIQPGFTMFWLFAFPGSWLVIPVTIVSVERELLQPAARFLYPALLVVLIPLMLLVFSLMGRLGQRVVGLTVVSLAVSLMTLNALGITYSPAIMEAPFAASVFDQAKELADLDNDGYANLFESMDCDEFDASINKMAPDRPGNGIDENCDGVDAAEGVFFKLGEPEPYPFQGARKFNVLVVIIDALRADHVHFMGYKRKTTPNLDRLAPDSIVFTRAISQYPSTGISIPTMLSGRYAEYMKWGKPRRSSQVVLKRTNTLLSDVLGENGYQTHAVVSAWIHRNIKGLKEHFQTQVPLYPHSEWKRWVRDSSKITATRAIEFIEHYDRKRPFFALVHFEEPHEPYVNHRPPGRVFGKKAIDRYDSDVYWADLWFGFLLGYLDQKELMDDTVLIVLADHGEEFKEHGKRFHGHQIYQESIHVPLLLKIPGVAGQTVNTRVALVDLFPTILDLTGIEWDRESLQGVSLLRTAAAAGEFDTRPIFSMLADRRKRPTFRCKAVVSGDYKYIHDITSDLVEFYDLAKDPGEKNNLVLAGIPYMEKMQRMLDIFLQNADPSWKVL